MSSLDVMLSSTSKDLEKHRKLAEDACKRADFSVKTMDYLSAENDRDAIDVSMRLVEESEVYVGIFGQRYGFRPDDPRNSNEISITEMEYRRAKELGMPILIFIMSDEHPAPDMTGMSHKQRQEAYADFYETDLRGIEKLELLKKEFKTNEIVGFFDSAEDLRIKILQSLSRHTLKEAAQNYHAEQQERAPESDDGGSAPQADIPYPPDLYAYPPYSGQSATFVGRRAEMQTLNEWSEPDTGQPMLVLEAIGGMGKSALTWRWVQDRAVPFEGIFWYSFYEGGAEMTAFVRHALAYVTRVSPDSLKQTSFPQMLSQLVHELKTGRFLLVLDGLERVLIAYHRWDAAQMQDDEVEEGKDYRDCTNPRDNDVLRQLAGCDPSRILISSRLMPNALTDAGKSLNGVKRVELKGLSRSDAQKLWKEHGITWSDDGVMDKFIQQFGRHSLLLKIMIDIIKKNRRANGDFQVWFVMYGEDFDVFADAKAKRHHILKFAYEGLSSEAQKLLSQMAALGNALDIDTLNVFNPYMNPPEVLRNPDDSFFLSDEERNALKQEYEATLKAKAEYERSTDYKRAIHKFDAMLQDLEERGLIWWDANNRQYDLHPVVRGYAFSQLSEDDKPDTFDNIYNYFEEQERGNTKTRFTSYAEMQNLIAMYNALIGAGKYDAAAGLFRDKITNNLIYGGLGLFHKAYELLLPLFANGLAELPIVTTRPLQGSILNYMGGLLSYLNRDEDALLVQANGIAIRLSLGYLGNLRISLNNYGMSLIGSNRLVHSLRALQLALILAKLTGSQFDIGWAHESLIEIIGMLGRWDAQKSTYNSFIQNPPEIRFQISGRQLYAKSLIRQGIDRNKIVALLDEAEQLNKNVQETTSKRNITQSYGDLAFHENKFSQAIQYYREAARIGNEQGVRDPGAWSGLARAYALSGNLTEALRIIEDGVGDHGFAAAVVYKENGDFEEATEAALEFYKWAWADGEPYVNRWDLEQARKILVELDVEEPQLPVWDEAKYEPFAHEEEIRALIERLKAEKAEQDDEDSDFDF